MRDHLPRRLKSPISNRRLLLLSIAIAIAIYRFYFKPQSSQPEVEMIDLQPPSTNATPSAATDSCTEWKGCFTGIVSQIADGDTLEIRSGAAKHRVRLVLVDAPEMATPEGPAAKEQLASICKMNSAAAVYPDLNQLHDEYGRTLGVVYCGGKNANEAMIRSGHARLYGRYCRASAFGKQEWAREVGCRE